VGSFFGGQKSRGVLERLAGSASSFSRGVTQGVLVMAGAEGTWKPVAD